MMQTAKQGTNKPKAPGNGSNGSNGSKDTGNKGAKHVKVDLNATDQVIFQALRAALLEFDRESVKALLERPGVIDALVERLKRDSEGPPPLPADVFLNAGGNGD